MTDHAESTDHAGGPRPGASRELFMRRPWLEELPAPPPLPAGFVLRASAPGDEPALSVLLRRAFADPAWDEGRVRAVLTAAPEVESVFVIAHAGKMIATASALLTPEAPASGTVHWVAADPEYQGRGLGPAVTLAVLRRFGELELRDALLQTQDYRIPAVRSYLRLGFLPNPHDPDEQIRWSRLLPRVLRGREAGTG